jgi:SAM-dependent methyltransferase
MMINKARVAKYLMNAMPSTPEYQETQFVSEVFRHPNYTSLSEPEKDQFVERLVRSNIMENVRKPFDLFFPSYPLAHALREKRVLDLGCGIGGLAFAMGDRWKVREFYGLDVNKDSIDTANRYAQRHGGGPTYTFVQGYGEQMPFDDGHFDAVVSHDTLEHVRSVKEALAECRRVLKRGGSAFLVFPSFKFPFGGAHIGPVTRTPFLEWFFSPDTIDKAFQEIVGEWGEELDWFRPAEETKEGWAVVSAGIGVNGTTYAQFVAAAEEVGFEGVHFQKIPLLRVSETANKYPGIKFLSGFLNPLLANDRLKDYLTHRLVFVLDA